MHHQLRVFCLLLLTSFQALGQIVPVYQSPQKSDYRQAEDAFKSAHILERTATAINSTVRIPAKMPLILGECGTVNAFYDPTHHSVHMCYELMEQIITGVMKDFGQTSTEHKMEAAYGAVLFVLLHEVGHGLSHTLNLPILGKEEDAADAIATYVVLNGRDPLPTVVGTLWFFGNSQRQPSLRDFADEHSLGQQRAFSLICKALGKDPAKYGHLAEQLKLPPERAKRCAAEYAQLRRSAQSLLGKYFIARSE